MSDVRFTAVDPLDAILAEIEGDIIASRDHDILSSVELRSLASQAKAVAEATLRATRSKATSRRQQPRPGAYVGRPSTHRATLRQLLVADSRVRKIAGVSEVDALSDDEIASILERSARRGFLPPEGGQED
ncbi:hypothetical protein [Mesorhizobium sp. GbtcB19]|uniref:hypothetical protein n=1 Tax=Mesorhizobium sp. GbtcB19 TaxID=2824764 RepID=UPI001C2FE298|nr:hypothetical protein [Mesorhizobium sp. GbtcB19]